MADFYAAIPIVMEHEVGFADDPEGGYVDDPADRGGATKWGISLRLLKQLDMDIDGDGDIDALDIRALTRERAGKIFQQEFWRFERLRSQDVATKMFDTAVNCSVRVSTKIAQRSLNWLGWRLAVDGLLGPVTVAAINNAPEAEFFREYRARQADFYARIVLRRPSQERFLLGWMRRAAF